MIFDIGRLESIEEAVGRLKVNKTQFPNLSVSFDKNKLSVEIRRSPFSATAA